MRSFIRLCLNRPVGVTAACILVAVLATAAIVRLPVALLPDLGYPALTVWTPYPDVPPDRVERSVTERIEGAVSGTQGLQRVTGRSQLGGSLVELRFGWNANLDLALLEVREQIDRLGNALPDEAERPVVLRVDPSERPIMMLALRGAARDDTETRAVADDRGDWQDLSQLRQIGREVVARRLEQLAGVARVRVTGGHERQVDVNIDPDRMARYGISVGDVGRALQQANAALSGGQIRRGPFRYAVEVSGEFESHTDIAETVVTRAGPTPIRVRDIAEVRPSVEERRGLVRLDGRESLLLLVERTPDANTVQAAEAVRTALAPLASELSGVALDVVVDESVFIEEAIGGVTQAVLVGGLLAILVLFGFLRRWRVVAAIGVAVPLSLGLTLIGFDLLGVSFNLIALSGLALGVGLLVDNAIIVVENIARLREAGRSAIEAAYEGTAEVAGAIAASTLTTIAVFLPITLVEGLAGRLFRDQSLAVVVALLASLLVALAVVPVIMSRDQNTEAKGLGLGLQGLLGGYERGLQWCLDRPKSVLMGALVVCVGAGALALVLPREVVPSADQGRVQAHLTLASGADLPLVSERAARLETAARDMGLARHVLADLGERTTARLELDPRPPYEGDLTFILADDVSAPAATARLEALDLPGDMTVDVQPAQTQLEALLVAGGAELTIDLVADEQRPRPALIEAATTALQQQEALAGVQRAEAQDVPGYRLHLRRDNMARFGVSSAQISDQLEAGARGRRASELRQIGEEIPIMVRTRQATTIDDLLGRLIPTANGLLPLHLFVEAERIALPAALTRIDQTPVARITAGVASGYDLRRALNAIDTALTPVLADVPRARHTVGGASTAFQEGLTAVGWSLLLSLLLVYLILTAQFERLLQPFVILAAVPLAAAGVVAVLGVTGQTINLMSMTGCVVLVGIVVNDAIIKVDFINQRLARGMDLRAAITAAGKARVRPILMTTVTTTLGLLPLALGFGAGAELRAPLAIAIVGGLLSATILTLFVVPVLAQSVARIAGTAR
ncbi:MAG: efflux RND transporter permease subunit [Longimonas sp.]|uniref:efflux RND transporter permease subunit n=1 Tax=Longimonas sp. TaxID=2039626 RepID=UPI0033598B1B